MTLYEFQVAYEDAQWNAIWEQGKFNDLYIEREIKFALDGIDHFFVEILWSVKTDEILRKKAFKEGRELDKYFPTRFNERDHYSNQHTSLIAYICSYLWKF